MNALIKHNEAKALSETFIKSGLFADVKSEAQAIVKVIAGDEMGLAPMASMQGINIIKGKVTLAAKTMAALIKRSGRYTYRVTKHNDKECEIIFYELLGGLKEECGKSAFTMNDAQKAGLMVNPVWKKYPRNMLFARAMSNGADWFCGDVFGGAVYTSEELGAEAVVADLPANVEVEKEVVATKPEATGDRLMPFLHALWDAKDDREGVENVLLKGRKLLNELPEKAQPSVTDFCAYVHGTIQGLKSDVIFEERQAEAMKNVDAILKRLEVQDDKNI